LSRHFHHSNFENIAKSENSKIEASNITPQKMLVPCQSFERINSCGTRSPFLFSISVPVCDLRNLAKDHTSERRTECTTDELYINAPYFTPGVASKIKAAVLGKSTNHDDISLEDGITFPEGQTIEEAIKSNLVTFFEKWFSNFAS
jgi:hypothetical protein